MEGLPPVCGVVFVFRPLRVIYDIQVPNRTAAGQGGSHRESSLLPIGHLGVIYASQLHSNALFL
jgi:hypothetical protein